MFFETKNVCFSYYKKPLCLKDINISIEKGQRVLIIGSKESAKTTILKVLSGFETRYFGHVMFKSKEIRTIADENKNFSFLPSEPVVLKNKSIQKNIQFFFDVTGKTISEEMVSESFKTFGLSYDFKTKLKKLSKCDLTIFSMIRSYLKNPEVLFLDDQFACMESEDEKIRLQASYKMLIESVDGGVFVAVGDESFLKNKDFLMGLKFDKILFLSHASAYVYKKLEDFEKSLPTLDATKFIDKLGRFECELKFMKGDYFVETSDSRLIKLNSNFYDRFSSLCLADGDSEKIVIAINNDLDIKNLSDFNFNKKLEAREIFMYLFLDESRLI